MNREHYKFHPEDLYSLVSDGHELASHTFSHVSSRALPLSAFRADVQKGQEAIRHLLGLTPSANFAYPYGEVTLAAKRALAREMDSCRGIYGGLNGPRIDLNLLRANCLRGDVSQFSAVEKLIAANEKHKAWLIFFTHDVCPNPSPFGCTPQLLRAVVNRVVKGGSRIATVAEILAAAKKESFESAGA